MHQTISIYGMTTNENPLLTGEPVLKRDYNRVLAYGQRAVGQYQNCAVVQSAYLAMKMVHLEILISKNNRLFSDNNERL
jgi:hypothetical protein